jgi:hypothetical protein
MALQSISLPLLSRQRPQGAGVRRQDSDSIPIGFMQLTYKEEYDRNGKTSKRRA